tara:strand:- start:9322 stop:10554 length:1233 start_codon:yes stop_codon:yes gene_type:complete
VSAQNVVNFSNKSVYEQITEFCNTPERIKECCKQNNSFTPEMFDPDHEEYIEGLIAVGCDEVFCDKEASKYQCRGDILNHTTVKKYAAQANQGVLNERGKREYGIRSMVNLIPRTELNLEKFVEVIGGYHRIECMKLTKLTFFPGKLDKEFLNLKTRYERNRYLRMLNSFPNNGQENDESDIRNGVAFALTTDSGVLQQEINDLNLINLKLQDQKLSKTEVISLKRRLTRVKTKVVDFLIDGVIEESGYRWTSDYAQKVIMNVINDWSAAENMATYTYDTDEMEDAFANEFLKINKKTTVLKRHSGKASGTRRQLRGDLWDMIISHKETYGKYPEEVRVIIALTSVGRVKNLHEKRLVFDNDLKRHINDAYPQIKVSCMFLGQAKSPGYVEDTNKLYTIEHVKQNLLKFT